ncbi:ras GEF [Pluteus cervinus]|uniref:Ras GEF n=1 Tax=Pluteus cervinus TaxID=181527 RepID=A0ACD3BG42_9AGAR|nr:ras GEF [Pluteus cervinus]
MSPRLNQNTLAPPQTLRKSISVDSFVKYGTESHSPPPSRPPVNMTRPPASSVSFVQRKDRDQNYLVSRHRGESLSNIKPVHESHYHVDSDVERSDILGFSGERHRHPSLRGMDYAKPAIKGGELPLPARAPILSPASSMGSIMTASTSSTTLEDIPPSVPPPSMPGIPRRGTTSSLPATTTSRSRSGSLGVYGSSMVGTPACGKSVAILNGLRSFNLSSPIDLPSPNLTNQLRCTRRIGQISNEEPPDCRLDVLEVDILVGQVSLDGFHWPEYFPRIDGIVICYDASNQQSFQPVEALLRECSSKLLPTMVLACKSDIIPRQIEPQEALEVLQQYDVGLIEISDATEADRDKVKRSFDFLLRSVDRVLRGISPESGRNPASPEVLGSSWNGARPGQHGLSSHASRQHLSQGATSPTLPNSPTRVRSVGDLLHEQHSRVRQNGYRNGTTTHQAPSSESLHGSAQPSEHTFSTGPAEEHKDSKDKERPAQWATLDELLDKLLFLAVSGDDPAFVTHFLLTYRRFATPRSVLLAMQKRMRQLDNPSGDPMFACFAQMRICNLLEQWIHDYPHDFSVRGTAGALSALIKSIISKTYLLHYGSEFLPFLEMLPNLDDLDSTWALKADVADESDDSDSPLDDDDESHNAKPEGTVPGEVPTKGKASNSRTSLPSSRERKSSLPLPKSLIFASGSSVMPGPLEQADSSPKQQIKELMKVAAEVMTLDPDEVAQEITRVEVKLFLDIQPRHWLHYTFVSGKKDSDSEPISAFNAVSNHLADWVISLILCHDRPKARAKQIEKFVEIAQRLRTLNNYSALRAFVAGINNATYAGDEALELFKSKSPEHAKNLQSWDVLLQPIRSHRAYRLALRNTKGACIPALEVHMSDLIKAHEGNDDFHADDQTKIHWGKFNMMGRFVNHTMQCQAQCKMATDYNFPDRNAIAELFVRRPVMTEEMRHERIGLFDPEFEEPRRVPQQQTGQTRDAALLRKLFFW